MEISDIKNNTAFKAIVEAQLSGPEGVLKNIYSDRYQIERVICGISGGNCWRRSCPGCQVAEEYVKNDIQDDVIGLFPINDFNYRGVSCKRNYNNSFCEFKSLEEFKQAFEGRAWVTMLEHTTELPSEIKLKYHVWNECTEIITDMYTVTEYMYLDNYYPLIIICTDRVFVVSPDI